VLEFLRTRSEEARDRTIELPLRMAFLAAEAAEIAADAADAADGPVGETRWSEYRPPRRPHARRRSSSA
jgi:hypothetical protein